MIQQYSFLEQTLYIVCTRILYTSIFEILYCISEQFVVWQNGANGVILLRHRHATCRRAHVDVGCPSLSPMYVSDQYFFL